MNVPEKHRAIAHAWVDGASIQSRKPSSPDPDLSAWTENSYPAWDNDYEYRIKPKPKPKVKRWRWVYRSIVDESLLVSDEYYTEFEASILNPIQKIDSTMIEVDE